MVVEFLDNVYFSTLFLIYDQKHLGIRIQKAFEFELGLVWIQAGQGHRSHCIQQHHSEFEFELIPVDQ